MNALETFGGNRLDAGQPPPAAALDGAVSRLRAVLTTALVAVLGFVPMAFAYGPGSEVQKPLATVVIGGLTTATLLTLIATPMGGRDSTSNLGRSQPTVSVR